MAYAPADFADLITRLTGQSGIYEKSFIPGRRSRRSLPVSEADLRDLRIEIEQRISDTTWCFRKNNKIREISGNLRQAENKKST